MTDDKPAEQIGFSLTGNVAVVTMAKPLPAKASESACAAASCAEVAALALVRADTSMTGIVDRKSVV